jgi:sorting nexin-41/42
MQIYGRFPPNVEKLSQEEMDPYFFGFETSTRELELLLQGNIEKVNRRTLSHLQILASDMAELGARYNAFSLSEQSPTLATAIERVGQAVDSSYIATEELSSSLGASFAEPMRESAQFAGVVRSVLRYRILKRVQEEMTATDLEKKKTLLDSLERSEMEAKRIQQYLDSTGNINGPRRTASSGSARSQGRASGDHRRENSNDDTESIDSDFPPTHGEAAPPSAPQGRVNHGDEPESPTHKKSPSGNFITNRLFGRISHAIQGVADVDPEKTRRDQIGKTRETLVQLEQALEVSRKDVKDASIGVMKDLQRFQKEKEEDLKRYMVSQSLVPTTGSGLHFAHASNRLHTPDAILNGPSGTLKHGRKHEMRWRRSKYDR